MKIYCFYLKLLDEYLTIPETGKSLSLYAWTADKELAKQFIHTRNMDHYRYAKRKTDKGVLDDTHLSQREINLQPLYDGIQEVMIPMTWQELASVNAKIDSIEKLAYENKTAIEKIMFPKKIKELLLSCNEICEHDRNGYCVSVINSFYVFMNLYGKYMSFGKKDK